MKSKEKENVVFNAGVDMSGILKIKSTGKQPVKLVKKKQHTQRKTSLGKSAGGSYFFRKWHNRVFDKPYSPSIHS